MPVRARLGALSIHYDYYDYYLDDINKNNDQIMPSGFLVSWFLMSSSDRVIQTHNAWVVMFHFLKTKIPRQGVGSSWGGGGGGGGSGGISPWWAVWSGSSALLMVGWITTWKVGWLAFSKRFDQMCWFILSIHLHWNWTRATNQNFVALSSSCGLNWVLGREFHEYIGGLNWMNFRQRISQTLVELLQVPHFIISTRTIVSGISVTLCGKKHISSMYCSDWHQPTDPSV